MHVAEQYGPPAPKLQSLTLHGVDVFSGQQQNLLDVLKRRRNHQMGLKKLALWSCRVSTIAYKTDLRGLVGRVIWDNVTEMGLDYELELDETDSEEFDYLGYWDYERGRYY